MSLNLLGALCSRVGGMIILCMGSTYKRCRYLHVWHVELIQDLSDLLYMCLWYRKGNVEMNYEHVPIICHEKHDSMHVSYSHA